VIGPSLLLRTWLLQCSLIYYAKITVRETKDDYTRIGATIVGLGLGTVTDFRDLGLEWIMLCRPRHPAHGPLQCTAILSVLQAQWGIDFLCLGRSDTYSDGSVLGHKLNYLDLHVRDSGANPAPKPRGCIEL
jgi:hypothetical protein